MSRESVWEPVNTEPLNTNTELVQKIVDSVYGTRYQFLGEKALQRVSESNDYYKYYDLEGQYWTPPGSIGYKPTVMPVNLARWFIRKRTGWMFEAAPDIECIAKQVDAQEDMEKTGYKPSPEQRKADKKAQTKEQFLYEVWDENRFPEKLMEAGRDYYIGGTVALKIRYLPGRGIRLNFSPCQEVFPVPNPDDPDIFDEVHFASFFDNDKTIWKQSWQMVDGTCYLTEGLYNLKLEPLVMKYTFEDMGLDFIPVLVFPRDRISGSEIFGTSYLKDMIPLFDQYNRSMSDASDSLRFNLFAVTVLLNAVPDAEQELKMSPGEIWNIGGDGVDAKKLESSFQYATALEGFHTRLENLMHMLADVPDITPDRIKGFGLVSGVALKLLYSDLVSATQQDWRVWKSRLVDANKYILRIAEKYGDFNARGDYTNRIIPHLPLPENDVEKIQMEAQKLGASMQSVTGALTEIGEKNPLRKLAEIITQQEMLSKAKLELANQYQGENNNGDQNQEQE